MGEIKFTTIFLKMIIFFMLYRVILYINLHTQLSAME
jgi:hypothetical protein